MPFCSSRRTWVLRAFGLVESLSSSIYHCCVEALFVIVALSLVFDVGVVWYSLSFAHARSLASSLLPSIFKTNCSKRGVSRHHILSIIVITSVLGLSRLEKKPDYNKNEK